MNSGEHLKQGFGILMEQFGAPVLVHRKGNSATYRGMKNNEENNRNKIMFQFPDPVDIQVEDVLQEQGARDLWEVYEIEDIVVGGTFINLNAWVHKKEAILGRQHAVTPNILIEGDNIGGIQIAGSKSAQLVTVTISTIHGELAALRKLAIEALDIEPLEKEEIRAALDRIEELSKREKSKNVLHRIKEKLEFVKVAMEVSEKAVAASPYIAAILEKLA